MSLFRNRNKKELEQISQKYNDQLTEDELELVQAGNRIL